MMHFQVVKISQALLRMLQQVLKLHGKVSKMALYASNRVNLPYPRGVIMNSPLGRNFPH